MAEKSQDCDSNSDGFMCGTSSFSRSAFYPNICTDFINCTNFIAKWLTSRSCINGFQLMGAKEDIRGRKESKSGVLIPWGPSL